MRTLPLYYMALWLHSWFFGVENVHAYLFLQSFFPGEPRAMVVSWSLVMEEYFYLFFPFAILMCASVIKPGVLSVIVISVGLIVICTVGRLLNVYGLQHVPAPVMHEHPFMRMDCAAYGVLAACLVSDNARTAQWMSASRCAWAFTFSVLIVVMWGILYTTLLHSPSSKLVIWGFPSWGPIYFAFQHSFLNMFFAVLIVSIFYMNIRMPYYLVFCVRNISCMSYSIYLFHTVIVEGANMYLPNEQSMTRFSLVIVVILAVAAISYYGIERPLLRLRDWLVPGRSTLARPGGHS